MLLARGIAWWYMACDKCHVTYIEKHCVDKEVDSLPTLYNKEAIVRILTQARLSINEFSRLMLLDRHSACVMLRSYQLYYDVVA